MKEQLDKISKSLNSLECFAQGMDYHFDKEFILDRINEINDALVEIRKELR